MNKKIIILALVFVIVILALAYIKIGPPPENVTVRVITPPSIIASLPMWVGEEKGIFKGKNINVKFVDLTNSKLMVETMLAGNADVLPAVSLADLATVGGAGNLALLHMKIYSHSRMRQNAPFDSILVSNGTLPSTLSDLKNKKIAVYPGMTSELAVRYFLKKNRIDDSSVHFVKLPPPEHEPALLRGDVQAIHVYEPLRSAALANGKSRELYGSVYAFLNEPSGIGASAISRKFLIDNSQAANNFFTAWNDSIEYIRAHPVEARQILAHKLGLTASVANSATWVDATKTTETSYETIFKTIESAKAAGIIPSEFYLEKDMVTSQ